MKWFFPQVYRCGNWVTDTLGNLPKFTQLASGRAIIQTQAIFSLSSQAGGWAGHTGKAGALLQGILHTLELQLEQVVEAGENALFQEPAHMGLAKFALPSQKELKLHTTGVSSKWFGTTEGTVQVGMLRGTRLTSQGHQTRREVVNGLWGFMAGGSLLRPLCSQHTSTQHLLTPPEVSKRTLWVFQMS